MARPDVSRASRAKSSAVYFVICSSSGSKQQPRTTPIMPGMGAMVQLLALLLALVLASSSAVRGQTSKDTGRCAGSVAACLCELYVRLHCHEPKAG
jgi:hypothetical protein